MCKKAEVMEAEAPSLKGSTLVRYCLHRTHDWGKFPPGGMGQQLCQRWSIWSLHLCWPCSVLTCGRRSRQSDRRQV